MLTGLLVLFLYGGLSLIVGYGVFYGLTTLVRGDETLVADPDEFLYAVLLLGTLVVGWTALTLLQVGSFSATRAVLISLGLSALFGGGAALCRRQPPVPRGPVTAFTWLLLGVAAAAVLAFFHPAEFVVGGGDAGVYVNLGAIWSREGSFSFAEEALQAVPDDLRPGLFRATPEGHVAEGLRLPGFYLPDLSRDVIVPQFFPLHPVWLAVVNGLIGLEASLYVTPLWAVLGLVSLVFTIRRLFGDQTGLLSGFLLLLTPLQVYFSRYPTAEALTQALIWAGLYAFVRFRDEDSRYWGAIAGLVLGQVFVTRIDALPILIVPLVWSVLALRQNGFRRGLWFLVPLAILLAQAAYQTVFLSWPYTWEIYGGLTSLALRLLRYVLYGAMVIVGVLAVGYHLLRRNSWDPMRTLDLVSRWGVACVLLVAAIYAYFIWPVIGETKLVPYWYGDSVVPVMNHENMIRLAWYLTPLGVWLGVFGIIWIVLREPWDHVWAVLLVGLSFSALYLYNILNNPFHVYAMRRYVPVVIPFFVVGMAYTIVRVWGLRTHWPQAGWVAVGLALVLAGWIGYSGRYIWTLVEYERLMPQIRDLASSLEPGAILLFDDEPTVGSGSTIGTPLQYLYGFTAYDLQEEYLSVVALAEEVELWVKQGVPVYWVEGPRPVLGPSELLGPSPAFGYWLSTELLKQSYHEFPDERVPYQVPLEFYRLKPGSSDGGCVLPRTIDIGTLDTLYLRSGFYSKELLGSRTVRWTDGDALVTLPCLWESAATDMRVDITVAAPRAPDMDQPVVSVSVGDQILLQTSLVNSFEIIRLTVPVSRLAEPTLRISSDTWVPSEYDVGSDSRRLGILIDSITIFGMEEDG